MQLSNIMLHYNNYKWLRNVMIFYGIHCKLLVQEVNFMKYYTIPVSEPLGYHMCGKFEALSPEWKHAELNLNDYELFIVTNGVLYIEYNNNSYRIEKGEMLLLPPVAAPDNVRKGYQSSSCTFYWLHFGLENHEYYSSILNDNKSYTPDMIKIPSFSFLRYPDKLIILMKQLQDLAREKAPWRTLSYMTTAIMCRLYDDINEKDAPETTKRTGKQLISDIKDYVNHNIHTNLSVMNIAGKFGYNDKYLTHMFKNITGETLKQYIISRKVEEANRLLTDTNISITEIAYILGYSDNHNFMKLYKEKTGMSPSEYRNAFDKRVLNH